MGNNLRSLFEEVRHIKETLGMPIPSQNALRYVKSQRVYENLRDKVNERLRSEGETTDFGVRELANLVNSFRTTIEGVCNLYATTTWIESDNEFVKKYFVPRQLDIMNFNPNYGSLDSGLGTLPAQIDYLSLICDFIVNYKKTRDLNKAYLGAFTKNSIKKSFLKFEDGTNLSLEDYKQRIDLHLEKANWASPEDLHMEGVEFSNEMFEELVLDNFNSDSCEVKAFFDNEYSFYSFQGPLNRNTPEEMDFLYSGIIGGEKNSPYRRAVEERTLGRMETERQIALHHAFRKSGTKLEDLIIGLETKIKKKRCELKSQEMQEMPQFMIMKDMEHIEEMRYTLVALKKNKKWLGQILDN